MTQGNDPLQRLHREDPTKQLLGAVGKETLTSAGAMGSHFGMGLAGLATGLVKGAVDIPMMLAAGGESTYHALKGDKNYKPTVDMEAYDRSWRDNTIKAVNTLTGKEANTGLNDESIKKSVASGQVLTSMLGPGHIPGFKFLKGGAAGITAEAGLKSADMVDRGINVAAKVASPIIDPLLKGASNLPGIKATKSGFNASSVVSDEIRLNDKIKVAAPYREIMANTLNPKSVTNSIKASNPGALPALSEKYNFPISNVDDLGQVLYPKFQQFKEAEKNPWNKIAREIDKANQTKYVDDIIKPKEYYTSIDIDKSARDLEQSLGSGKIKSGSKSAEELFIEKELSDVDLSPKARALLKDRMITSLLEQKEFHDLDSAGRLYSSKIKQAREGKLAEKELQALEQKPNLTPEEVLKKNSLLDSKASEVDYDSILDSARKLRTNFDNHYKNALFSANEEHIVKANDLRIQSDLRIMKDLEEIDPKLVVQYDKASTDSMIGSLGALSNMFKMEPTIGDLTQVAEAFPSSARNNAELLGVDYEHAISQQKGFHEWSKSNKDLVKTTLMDKYKNSIQALKEQENLDKPLSRNSFFNHMSNEFTRAGFAFQNQNKERIIESIILPKAYGQIKAWGKYEEGTKEFNRAVINHATKFIEDVGMSPPKSSYVHRSGTGKYEVHKNIDEAFKESVGRADTPAWVKKELKSGALMMSTWVKGATQAKLQAYNGVVESLREIAVTGKVTDAQRSRIVSGLTSIAFSTALFGARGMRVPALFQELPSSGNNTNQSIPETLGTHLVDIVQKLVGGMTNEQRELLREGAWGHFSGLSGARTETTPIMGMGLGNSISTSLLTSKLNTITDGFTKVMQQVSHGNYSEGIQEALTDAIHLALPTDIDAITDAQLRGGRLDSNGNLVAPDPDKYVLNNSSLGRQLGAVSKNMSLDSTPDNGLYLGGELTSADTLIAKKYNSYNIKEYIQDGHFEKTIEDLKKVYPEDSSLIEKKLKSIIKEKLTPESSKLFKKLKSNASDLLAIDKQVLIEEYPALSKMSRKQALDLAAESGATEKNLAVFNLVVKAGKLKDLTNDEIDYITKKVEEIQTQKTAIFGDEEEEDTTQSEEE